MVIGEKSSSLEPPPQIMPSDHVKVAELRVTGQSALQPSNTIVVRHGNKGVRVELKVDEVDECLGVLEMTYDTGSSLPKGTYTECPAIAD